MSLASRIAAIRKRRNLGEDEKRRRIYAIKVDALIEVASDLIGLDMDGVRINAASATPQPALFLDVTFSGGELAEPITHQITIVNPPILPARGTETGNERQDLIKALHEMLEGFD